MAYCIIKETIIHLCGFWKAQRWMILLNGYTVMNLVGTWESQKRKFIVLFTCIKRKKFYHRGFDKANKNHFWGIRISLFVYFSNWNEKLANKEGGYIRYGIFISSIFFSSEKPFLLRVFFLKDKQATSYVAI